MPTTPLDLPEPSQKRCIAFFDGQNLFYCAREAFGYTWPNYDPIKLAQTVCACKGWVPKQVFFYTGVPSDTVKPHWNHFWNSKLAVMGTRGIVIYSRELKYSNQPVQLPDGTTRTVLVGREKGIDVRIALDVVRLARKNEFDVALIFSQDQDLSEVGAEVRAIAQEKARWIKVASAFPISPTSRNVRGINDTDWIKIDQAFYDACIDPTGYRLKK